MKRKLIVSLTGIAMSLALAVTGCAGTTGTTGTASEAGSAASETDTRIAQGNSADNNENSDASADESQTDSSGKKKKKGTGDGSGSEKPSGKKSKGSDSGETTAELKTVEPGTYAGQTVYGKVTSIADSQITVKLGTYNKDASKDASVTQTSVTEDTAEVIEAVAASDDNSTDTSSGNTDAKSKKKKSRFTANGEQMTVTIPESLSGIEIKEKYVLSITLDDQGNVTAIEVVSKGRSKLKGPDSGKDGSGSESGQDTENSTDINDKETNNL